MILHSLPQTSQFLLATTVNRVELLSVHTDDVATEFDGMRPPFDCGDCVIDGDIACELWQRERSLPPTKTGLLALALKKMLERSDEKRGRTAPRSGRNLRKQRLLRWVAWEFFSTGPERIEDERLDAALQPRLRAFRRDHSEDRLPETVDELVRELLADGILVPAGEGYYRFVLRTFHEYCLAGWIAWECRLVKEDDPEEFIAMIRGRTMEWGRDDWPEIKPLNQPAWEVVWPLVGSQMQSNQCEWFLKILWSEHLQREDTGFSRLRLAASAIAEVDGFVELRESIVTSIGNILRSADTPMNIVPHCQSALLRLLGEPPLEELIAYLKDPDTPDQLRTECAYLLGERNEARARDVLLIMVQNRELPEYLRDMCVCALKGSCDEESKVVLVSVLQDRETPESIRGSSADSLAQGWEVNEVRDVLISTFRNDDTPDFVRQSCVDALTLLADDKVIDALLESVCDEKVPAAIRLESVVALGAFHDQRVNDALLSLARCRETQSEIRNQCLFTLGMMKDERVRPFFLAALRKTDKPCHVRERCARVLAQFGEFEATDVVLDLLQEPDTPEDVKCSCMVTLTKHAARNGVRACDVIARVLNDLTSPDDIRKQCAYALLRIDSKHAREILHVVFQDSRTPDHIRSHIGVALGALADRHTRMALQSVVNDPTTPLLTRASAMNAICSIRERTGWRMLRSGRRWEKP